jgi:hypothetical protein
MARRGKSCVGSSSPSTATVSSSWIVFRITDNTRSGFRPRRARPPLCRAVSFDVPLLLSSGHRPLDVASHVGYCRTRRPVLAVPSVPIVEHEVRDDPVLDPLVDPVQTLYRRASAALHSWIELRDAEGSLHWDSVFVRYSGG